VETTVSPKLPNAGAAVVAVVPKPKAGGADVVAAPKAGVDAPNPKAGLAAGAAAPKLKLMAAFFSFANFQFEIVSGLYVYVV
jgi:hypothetical protein